jgi:Arc/MetJ family transcription regulator
MLLQQAKIDHDYLQSVLERYGLKEKWQAFISEANRP